MGGAEWDFGDGCAVRAVVVALVVFVGDDAAGSAGSWRGFGQGGAGRCRPCVWLWSSRSGGQPGVSGRVGECLETREGGGEVCGPGPGRRQAQAGAAGVEGQACGDV
jgi:hypothetical protein